jgi:hypothetical protein
MAIIVKPHGDFAPNTTAESAKVNDQLNTIYADHNGGLLDANIAATANIQQAKVHNLTSDLAATNANVNTLFNNFNVTLSTVSTDVGEPSSAFVGEAQLYVPIFVAANALGSDNYLYLSQDFLINIATDTTFKIKYYFGGTLFFDPLITNATGISQTNVAAHVDITLRARGAVNAQYGIGRMFLQTSDPNFYMGSATGQNQFLNSTGLAVDSTADQILQINAFWDKPGNVIFGVGSSCWMVK